MRTTIKTGSVKDVGLSELQAIHTWGGKAGNDPTMKTYQV